MRHVIPHMYMGDGKFDNKHGVAILLEQEVGAKRINWTEHINERAFATSITVNEQRIMLMGVYTSLPHGVCRPTSKRAHNSIEKITNSKKIMQIIGGDFNAELGPCIGFERLSVGPHALKESNSRGD